MTLKYRIEDWYLWYIATFFWWLSRQIPFLTKTIVYFHCEFFDKTDRYWIWQKWTDSSVDYIGYPWKGIV